MTISAADLRPLKTQEQKSFKAYQHDLGIGIGSEEEARRQAAPPKPKGKKPLYHSYFGPYFFWVVTGRSKSEMYGEPAEEYYGPTRYQQHFGSITRWITELLGADKEELSFNQYAYLKDLLQKQVAQFGNDAPHFRELVEWLQEQADKADAYASLFFPLRYNVRTLLNAGKRDLDGPVNLAGSLEYDEPERLDYYQRIEKRRAELAEEHLVLREQLQAANREATDRELNLLSRLEKQLEFLALNQLDQLDYNRLLARAKRKQNAAEFKAGLQERLLQPSPSGIDLVLKYPGSFQPDPDSATGLFPPRIIFTLSELTREFDANIELCDTPASRAAYAAEQLRLFDTNRPHIIRHYDHWSEMDDLKVTALKQVLIDLRSLYEQHQRQKLRSFLPTVSSPPMDKFIPRLPNNANSPTETEVKPTEAEDQQAQQGKNQFLEHTPATPAAQIAPDNILSQAPPTGGEQPPVGNANEVKSGDDFSPFSKELNFTEEMADLVAVEIELIDESGNYRSDNGNGGKKAGRLCGFYWQLKARKKVVGNLEQLRDYFFLKYLKESSRTSPDTSSQAAQKTAKATEIALNKLFPPKRLT